MNYCWTDPVNTTHSWGRRFELNYDVIHFHAQGNFINSAKLLPVGQGCVWQFHSSCSIKTTSQTLSSELNLNILDAVTEKKKKKKNLHIGSHSRLSDLRTGLPFLQFRFWKHWNPERNFATISHSCCFIKNGTKYFNPWTSIHTGKVAHPSFPQSIRVDYHQPHISSLLLSDKSAFLGSFALQSLHHYSAAASTFILPCT